MEKIKILSFFSGGGFLDMGFEMAGFEIVWSNEFDKVFAQLHSSGITSWRKSRGNGIKAEIFNTKSIEDISSKEIVSEAFPDGKPSSFGIIGGPPCQDFSMNGKHDGFNGERGKMTIRYFEKISELSPSFFIMENVTGLVKNKSHKEHLAKLIKRITKKYHFDYKILNAIEFGVPQFRERVFFVGIRKDYMLNDLINNNISQTWFNWPEKVEYKNAIKKYLWPKPNIYGILQKKSIELPLELCVENCLIPEIEIDSIPNANEFFNLRIPLKKIQGIKEGETNRPSFKRLHRFKYSPTACYGNNEVHLHPYENRRLSVRETLRIQGVPDTYVLPKEIALSKKFKMIGNGVPVPLAEAVAVAMKSFLKDNLMIK